MKLSEFITDIGRPIAYYPGLRKITGSTTSTIFICQLIYWTGKERSGDGWIYKESAEIEEETGMSYDEQITARKKLLSRDLIEENYARLEHKMYFRVKLDVLNALWEIPETGIANMGNPEPPSSTNVATPSSLNRESENTPDTTTETTNTGAKPAPPEMSLPLDWQIAKDQAIEMPSEEQQFQAEYGNSCMQICRGNADLETLVVAFMKTRKPALPGKKKGNQWRIAFREMKSKGVCPEHLIQAIVELEVWKPGSVVDPFSPMNKAISIANPSGIEKVPTNKKPTQNDLRSAMLEWANPEGVVEVVDAQ